MKGNAPKPTNSPTSDLYFFNEEGAADGHVSDDDNPSETEETDTPSPSLRTSFALPIVAFFGERLNELSENISSFPRNHSTAYNIACTVAITTVIVGVIVGITAATFGIVPAAVALATVAAVAGHAIAGAGVVTGTAIATHKLITASAVSVSLALSAFATAMFFDEKNEAKKKTEASKQQVFKNPSCLGSQ